MKASDFYITNILLINSSNSQNRRILSDNLINKIDNKRNAFSFRFSYHLVDIEKDVIIHSFNKEDGEEIKDLSKIDKYFSQYKTTEQHLFLNQTLKPGIKYFQHTIGYIKDSVWLFMLYKSTSKKKTPKKRYNKIIINKKAFLTPSILNNRDIKIKRLIKSETI